MPSAVAEKSIPFPELKLILLAPPAETPVKLDPSIAGNAPVNCDAGIVPVQVMFPVTSRPPFASRLPAISTVPSACISNLSTVFVTSEIVNTPPFPYIEKSGLWFESTRSILGSVPETVRTSATSVLLVVTLSL